MKPRTIDFFFKKKDSSNSSDADQNDNNNNNSTTKRKPQVSEIEDGSAIKKVKLNDSTTWSDDEQKDNQIEQQDDEDQTEQFITETAFQDEEIFKTYVQLPTDDKKRWNQICETFQTIKITSPETFRQCVLSYHGDKSWKFSCWSYFVRKELTSQESAMLFGYTIPCIIEMILQTPKLFSEQQIPLLIPNKQQTVLLSRPQILCLLCNAFFCTFPVQGLKSGYNFPNINFSSLYNGMCNSTRAAKFRCFLHYFERAFESGISFSYFFDQLVPQGNLSFHRRALQNFPAWNESTSLIKANSLEVFVNGCIEDSLEDMQLLNANNNTKQGTEPIAEIDFANKFIGGGVLGNGCVQEEIRFLIAPELIVSRLFTARIEDNECIIITGAERFSSYRGYSYTFEFAGDYRDPTPSDANGRKNVKIVAMDAINFGHHSQQFDEEAIVRELNKAYVAFLSPKPEAAPIATGNWGCGAFNGDTHLKFVLQLMSAAHVNRTLFYYCWGDDRLAQDINKLYEHLVAREVTVGNLYQAVLTYCKHFHSTQDMVRLIPWLLIHFSDAKPDEITDETTQTISNNNHELDEGYTED